MLPVPSRRAVPLLAALTLAACASGTGTATRTPAKGTAAAAASVTPSPHRKLGSPYFIKGIRYVPKEDPGYVREGIASWYGPQFHGKLTANGELFDQDRLTAAHKTLPLPSLVRITNLENGKDIVVRLNDRGPFAGDRIIDLSRGTARALGTLEKGLARVRVEYLGPASLDHAIVSIGARENYAALDPRRQDRRDRSFAVASRAETSSADALTLAAAGVASGAAMAAGAAGAAGATGATGATGPSAHQASGTEGLPPLERPIARVPSLKPGTGGAVMAEGTPRIPRIKSETAAITDRQADPIVVADTRLPRLKPTAAPAAASVAAMARPGDTIEIVYDGAPLPADPVPDIQPFYVQVASFSNASNAASAAGLFPPGVPVSLESVFIGEQPTQRLRLGPYTHEFAAEAAQRVAVERGFTDARIIRVSPSL